MKVSCHGVVTTDTFRVKDLPDISRFVRRKDKVNINNTVKLTSNSGQVIEVSGTVLSQCSEKFAELVSTQDEIELPHYFSTHNEPSQERSGLQDCIELMYGGTVQISSSNIEPIVNFSDWYEVKAIQALCVTWFESHIEDQKLFLFLRTGFAIQDPNFKAQVLGVCKRFIVQEKYDLVKLGYMKTIVNFRQLFIDHDDNQMSQVKLDLWL